MIKPTREELGQFALSLPVLASDPFVITPARYAKGKMKIQCKSVQKSMYKERQHRLAEALARGRYTGRENAYIVSPNAAKRFLKLWREGWDASSFTYELEAPRKEAL